MLDVISPACPAQGLQDMPKTPHVESAEETS